MSAAPDRPPGRGWAYAGVILGGLVSTAANVAHSYLPPADAPENWTPYVGAVVSAIFWPAALFVVVEIFARTVWPPGWHWTLLRYLGLGPVALVAALVSYRHMSGLLRHYGEDGLTATLGPLAVDGLMTMAAAALLASGHRRTSTATPAATTAPATPPPPAVDAPAPAPVPAPIPVPAPPVKALRLPVAMREAVAERARQVTAEGRELTAADVRAAVRVPEDMAAQIVRDLATAGAATTAPAA